MRWDVRMHISQSVGRPSNCGLWLSHDITDMCLLLQFCSDVYFIRVTDFYHFSETVRFHENTHFYITTLCNNKNACVTWNISAENTRSKSLHTIYICLKLKFSGYTPTPYWYCHYIQFNYLGGQYVENPYNKVKKVLLSSILFIILL